MVATSQEVRSLRSTNSVKNVEDKFDFDVDEFEILPSKPLKVISRGYPVMRENNEKKQQDEDENRRFDELHGLGGKTESIAKMILEIDNKKLKGKSMNYTDDELPDHIYSGFHKKMLKQETRMLETELVQSENEAERLHLLYEKLDLTTWLTTLRKITVIHDPDDEEETLKKKEKTQQYIRSILDKFDLMKKRSNMLARNYKTGKIDPSRDWPKLYKKVDRKLVINFHSSSDEEEESMTAEEIRVHRRKEIRKQVRGSIIIQLTTSSNNPHTKYAIIAEPLSTPYVIKVAKEERKKWNKIMKKEPKKFEYHAQLPNQVAVPKRKVPLPQMTPIQDHSLVPNIPIIDLKQKDEISVGVVATKVSTEINNKGNDLHTHTPNNVTTHIHTPPIRRKRRKQK